MTRTERQKEAIKKWIIAKGKGTIEATTGFGKTRIGLMTIQALLKKYPHFRVLVVVPTTALKDQWESNLYDWELSFNCEVQVINSVIKHKWNCDVLIIDEIHRTGADSFKEIFNKVSYRLVMGLTATFDRLDGKEFIISKYCPKVDIVSVAECLANEWISEYKEYQVLIEVDDINTYKEYNKEWLEHFEFFNYSFETAMNCIGSEGWRYKLKLRDEIYAGSDETKRKEVLNSINYHAAGFIRTMQKRKAFINNHPKKIEIARKIIEARQDKKIITFSNNIKMAEAIQNGQNVYSGKTSKKKGRVLIEDFNNQEVGVLNTIKKADEGLDVRGLSVAIIIGTDSSETKARQRRGRTIRKEGSKIAEVFYIIIKDTIESKWYSNSHKNDRNYITIDEEGLEQVLRGEQPNLYKDKIKEFVFRY